MYYRMSCRVHHIMYIIIRVAYSTIHVYSISCNMHNKSCIYKYM
jgi:hypothetical protein